MEHPESERNELAYTVRIEEDETDEEFFRHTRQTQVAIELSEIKIGDDTYLWDDATNELYDARLYESRGILRKVGKLEQDANSNMYQVRLL
jgi:hypothetical protein